METIKNNTRSRKPTYKDQLAALRMRGEDLYSIGGNVLHSKLDKFYAALDGTYEYHDSHARKTVHARSYKKRIEFAEKELKDIESLLYTQRKYEKMNDDQVRQVALYVRSLYQVAIRDNKYAQKNLEGNSNTLPENIHFPILYQYSKSNSKKALDLRKRTQEFGTMINSLESRIEERKFIAESLHTPSGYALREKNPLVYTLMEGKVQEKTNPQAQNKKVPEQKREEVLEPASSYALQPRSLHLSGKQREVVGNFLGTLNFQIDLMHLNNATGAAGDNTTLVYTIPPVIQSRSARAETIRQHSPFHKNLQRKPEEDNIYHSATHLESPRGIFDRILGKVSIGLKTGLCIAGLFLPVGPTHSKNASAPHTPPKPSFVQTLSKSESQYYPAAPSHKYYFSPRENVSTQQTMSQD